MATARLQPELLQLNRKHVPVPRRWSAEFELLLACSHPSIDRDHIGEVLARTFDWDEFVRLVEHHRLLPHVYSSFLQISDLIPTHVMSGLRSEFHEHARKSLWFAAELSRILGHFEDRGVSAVPHKGPVLAQLLYGDVTGRQFCDLDILVEPENLPRAKSVLSELGYEPTLQPTELQERAYLKSGYEYAFDSPVGKNILELQWRILPRFYAVDLEIAVLFDRTVEIPFGKKSVRTLTLEDLLIVLCIHAAKHVWSQLCWLRDIVQLVASSTIDWDSVLKRTSDLGIARIVAVNLLLVRELFGVTLPDHVQDWLKRDPDAPAIVDEIITIVARSVHYETESFAYFRLMLRSRERWQDRIRLLWRLSSTPSVGEWQVVDLPRMFFPLYRGLRLGRLVKRFVTSGTSL